MKIDLPPLKNRIFGYILGVLMFFTVMFFMDFPFWLNIFLTVMSAVLLTLATVLEIRSKKRDKNFVESIKSGEYFTDEKRVYKYSEYSQKHGFERVKSKSMQSPFCLSLRTFLRKFS